MNDCPTCGARNADQATFCETCGTRLETSQVSRTIVAPPPSRTIVTPTVSSNGIFARLFGARAAAAVPAPTNPPFVIYDNKSETTIPLRQSFRFVHEPVGLNSGAPFVGRQNEMESLAERILFSDGGSFLVTGYRGVGKTSFINQVISMVRDAAAWARPLLGETEVVDIQLNVARPVQPSEIMHHIIRRLHDRLVDLEIYPHLDGELRDALSLAFQRTSVNMARQLGESSERSFGVNEASLGGDFLKAAMKMSWSTKRGRTSNTEMSYLGYDDKAAEHDIITIARRLTSGYARTPTRWQRMRLQRVSPRRQLKIVFVFDELDKLEEFTALKFDDTGKPVDQKPVIDQILGALKNLFTTSGVSFVFVAGKDLQERWLEDIGRGDSVYESVFSYDKYLPCLWADVDAICDALVDRAQTIGQYRTQVFEAFKKYLAYRGRGIPRRIIRTFNEYVEWDGDQPALAFTNKDVRRIRFFAGLQDLLEANRTTLFGDEHEEIAGTQSDKRRLGVYYLLDWMLRQGAAEFTLADVLRASARLSAKIALAEEIAPHVAENIVRILLDAAYIETPRRSQARVVVGDANVEEQRRYRVTQRRLVEMGAQPKDPELDAIGPRSDPYLAKEDRLPTVIGRFRIVNEIAKGGMGIVYRAIDGRNGRDVALKLLAPSLASNPELEARFEREARILDALDHPDVVRLVDWGRDLEHRLFIAMELIDGVTLDDVTRRLGKLDPVVAAALVRRVAEAAEYVHERGVVRLDLKPSNIMLAIGGGLRLLDFGISRRDSDDAGSPGGPRLTQTGLVVGTPQFMAPEQFSRSVADARSDVYSLGVILFHLLTDRYPFEADDTFELMRAHVEKAPPLPSSFAPAARALDAIVMRCLEKDPDRRFQTMSALANELATTMGASTVNVAELVAQVRAVARDADALDDMRTQEGQDPRTRAAQITPTPATSAPVMVASPQRGAKTDEHPWPPPSTMESIPLAPRSTSQVTSPGVGSVAPHDPRPRLTLVRGQPDDVVSSLETVGASLLLAKETRVGRNSANEIVLRHASVSRFHATFSVADGQCTVEDANTPRGTFVNGVRIIEPCVLGLGDEIQIGEIAFRYDGL